MMNEWMNVQVTCGHSPAEPLLDRFKLFAVGEALGPTSIDEENEQEKARGQHKQMKEKERVKEALCVCVCWKKKNLGKVHSGVLVHLFGSGHAILLDALHRHAWWPPDFASLQSRETGTREGMSWREMRKERERERGEHTEKTFLLGVGRRLDLLHQKKQWSRLHKYRKEDKLFKDVKNLTQMDKSHVVLFSVCAREREYRAELGTKFFAKELPNLFIIVNWLQSILLFYWHLVPLPSGSNSMVHFSYLSFLECKKQDWVVV